MPQEPEERRNWTDGELDLIVADYFLMLQDEATSKSYNKAEHNRLLRRHIERSEGSIEFKHQNISAVLLKLGLPRIIGYVPAANYQKAIIAAIDRYLSLHPVVLHPERTVDGLTERQGLFVGMPPPVLPIRPPKALCRVFDFSASPRMFELTPPLDNFVHLSPLSYEASFS